VAEYGIDIETSMIRMELIIALYAESNCTYTDIAVMGVTRALEQRLNLNKDPIG